MHCRIDKLYRARINLTVNNALPEGGNIAMAYELYDEAKTGEELGEAWLFKKNSEQCSTGDVSRRVEEQAVSESMQVIFAWVECSSSLINI
jgi:hypothetical protein